MNQVIMTRPSQHSRPTVAAVAGTVVAALLLLSIAVFTVDARAQVARLNLTGTWDGSFMGGTSLNLFQEGDNIWGKFAYGNGSGFARGSWSDGRLILILTPTTAQVGGACDARKILLISAKDTATRVKPFLLDLAMNASYVPVMNRTSPSPGQAVEYPYEAELKNCGQLFTYELTFATNSDKLKGANWPILGVLADLLKKDSSLKIQIVGHTDSTGDPKANQELSERRAKAARQTLIDHFGADANQLIAKGYGMDQPLAPNESEQGRAINRRVEVIKQ